MDVAIQERHTSKARTVDEQATSPENRRLRPGARTDSVSSNSLAPTEAAPATGSTEGSASRSSGDEKIPTDESDAEAKSEDQAEAAAADDVAEGGGGDAFSLEQLPLLTSQPAFNGFLDRYRYFSARAIARSSHCHLTHTFELPLSREEIQGIHIELELHKVHHQRQVADEEAAAEEEDQIRTA